MTSPMIKEEVFSPSAFVRRDIVSLVKLLKAVHNAGSEGISTRKLCIASKLGTDYGLRVIERAEKEEYIVRTGKKLPSGGGKARVVKLTEKGRSLLQQLNSSSNNK